MRRVILYTITDNSCVIPTRKAYKKARFKRKMGRYHECPEFRKNKTKSKKG